MEPFIPEGVEGLERSSTVRQIGKVGRVVNEIIVPFLEVQVKSTVNH